MQPLALNESEVDDIVELLATLTSAQYQEQGIKELARQHAIWRTDRPQRYTARAFGPKPVQTPDIFLRLFLAVSLSGLSGLGCSLEPMRIGVNTELMPVRLGHVYTVVLSGLFDVDERQGSLLI